MVDRIIMLFKERIDKWDVSSVGFATRELFEKLFNYSERGGVVELYMVFRDLFRRAYSERRQVLGAMIKAIGLIMFRVFVDDDVEKASKATKLVARLGIDFIRKDLSISRDCATQIDNLAGDMFEPSILAKEIILAASILKAGSRGAYRQLTQDLVDWITTNDEYAWDAMNYTYLRDSIEYARSEQDAFGVDIRRLVRDFLKPGLERNIDMQIDNYAEFIEGLASEGDTDLKFAKDDLLRTITAYKLLRPNIAHDIKRNVWEAQNVKAKKVFNDIVKSDRNLKRIYEEWRHNSPS